MADKFKVNEDGKTVKVKDEGKKDEPKPADEKKEGGKKKKGDS